MQRRPWPPLHIAGINRSPRSSRRKPAGRLQFPKRCSGRAPVDIETGRVKLTDLAACGGCAAKYSAARLEELLAGFVPGEAEKPLGGLAPAGDAAGHRLDDERAPSFTPAFFPPAGDGPGGYRGPSPT